jgi:hypothetical protein
MGTSGSSEYEPPMGVALLHDSDKMSEFYVVAQEVVVQSETGGGV